MAAKAFISYRRADALHAAGRIKDRLQAAHPDVDVFMDVDSMPAGGDFVKYLQDRVAACDVLLAVIGTNWLTARDAAGGRRLDDEKDVVRVEIAAALSRNIPVVPIALDEADFPGPQDLPEELRPLALQAGVELHGAAFGAGMARLLAKLEPLIKQGAIQIGVGARGDRQQKWIVPGSGKVEWFSDFAGAPQLVVVPAGRFTMGAPPDEPGRDPDGNGLEETSTHELVRPFAVGRFAVTVGQFGLFVDETGHDIPEGAYYWTENADKYLKARNRSWRDPRFEQGDDHPVVAVSWHDAHAYADWLSQRAGRRYRLPTSAEWEYAARAGATTPFHWGATISPTQANFDARRRYRGGGDLGTPTGGTVPVDRYRPNGWGLYQVHGNVWELCADSWPGYPGGRICRGGSFEDWPEYLRAAMCSDVEECERYVSVGFRVARDITD